MTAFSQAPSMHWKSSSCPFSWHRDPRAQWLHRATWRVSSNVRIEAQDFLDFVQDLFHKATPLCLGWEPKASDNSLEVYLVHWKSPSSACDLSQWCALSHRLQKAISIHRTRRWGKIVASSQALGVLMITEDFKQAGKKKSKCINEKS